MSDRFDAFFLDGEPCIVNDDCKEENSRCQANVCTSTGTQTISTAHVAVQTTQSLESPLSDEAFPNVKISSFSNRRTRNYIKYHKLEDSEATKFSSVDDESTQCEYEAFENVNIGLWFNFSWRIM